MHEFKDDNERFLESAERIMDAPCTQRDHGSRLTMRADDWESWHGVILPPSFPYGGMENPSVLHGVPPR